jgi:hypothetical protein
MGRIMAIALLAAGCYRPTPSPGAPCPDGACPTGQQCVAGTCRAEGEPAIDAEVADDAPAPAPDAPAPDAPPDAPGPWLTPVPIPGVNTGSDESDPSLTADRLTIVFISDRPGGLGGDDLYLGTRGAVTEPFTVTPLTALSSPAQDRSPEISVDGGTLYFTSSRNGGYDVYVSTLAGGAWSAPQRVDALSSGATEGDVAISPDGLTAIVERSGALYFATRPSIGAMFGAPVLVPELDVGGDVASPSLANGAATVYLHAGSVRDLYVAYRQGTSFTAPAPVAELNTPVRDAAPFLSPDGARLAFERDGDLYEASR